MCLIAISPKGKDKYSDFFLNSLRSGAARNRDGYGYSYKRESTGYVFTKKGFVDINHLIDELVNQKIKEEDELIVHMRTSSAGNISSENTHPFELNYESPNSVPHTHHGKITSSPLLFHNGTMFDFKDVTKNMSDTYNFANNFLKIKHIWLFLKNDTSKFLQVFDFIIKNNKFAIMSQETETILIGDWLKIDGYIFSNEGYKPYNDYLLPSRIISNPTSNVNTKVITLDETNFDRFYVKSTCRSAVGSPIDKDVYFYIRKLDTKTGSVMLEERETKGSYKFITIDTLKSVFVNIPKQEWSKQYIDYAKLVSTIKVTKSAIKKIYNKVLSVSSSKKIENIEQIKMKYHSKIQSYNYYGVLLFLNDHKNMIDAYKIDALLKLSEPVELKPESCEC